MYPLVRELSGYRVLATVTRRVLKLARQPHYRWLACPVTDADLEAAYRANALFEAHRDDPEFGYRFLTDHADEAAAAAACESMAARTTCVRSSAAPAAWWSALGEARQEQQAAGAAGPRRPGQPRLHR